MVTELIFATDFDEPIPRKELEEDGYMHYEVPGTTIHFWCKEQLCIKHMRGYLNAEDLSLENLNKRIDELNDRLDRYIAGNLRLKDISL